MSLPTSATDPDSVLTNLNYAVTQVGIYLTGLAALTALSAASSYNIGTSPNNFTVSDDTSVATIQQILNTQLSGYNAAYLTLVQELIAYGQAVLATLQTPPS